MNSAAIIRLLIAMARMLDISPYDLALAYLNVEENQEWFEELVRIAGDGPATDN